jgi:hypothetical protein
MNQSPMDIMRKPDPSSVSYVLPSLRAGKFTLPRFTRIKTGTERLFLCVRRILQREFMIVYNLLTTFPLLLIDPYMMR